MELNKIFNESCLDTLKRFPDDYLDLVVTSPPYYAGKEYEDSEPSEGGYRDYADWNATCQHN